jgi:hypothetical protein
MAAGKPVVALDGPGVREIVRDGENGILLGEQASPGEFAAALGRLMQDSAFSQRCSDGARRTAEGYHADRCVERILECYQELVAGYERTAGEDPMPWDRLLAGINIEWNLFVEKRSAAASAVSELPAAEAGLD